MRSQELDSGYRRRVTALENLPTLRGACVGQSVVLWSTSEVAMDDANRGRDGLERDRIVWVGKESCASGSVKATTSHCGFVGVVLDVGIGVHRGSRHERRWRKRHGWGGAQRGQGGVTITTITPVESNINNLDLIYMRFDQINKCSMLESN
ncbi:hypothetical protein U1Q18_022384 [Sarracenia purpurea var. burkii]